MLLESWLQNVRSTLAPGRGQRKHGLRRGSPWGTVSITR